MLNYWRAIVAALLLSSAGCCHNCGCCDTNTWGSGRPPAQINEGPLPVQHQAPATVGAPPAGPRGGTGAYGGS